MDGGKVKEKLTGRIRRVDWYLFVAALTGFLCYACVSFCKPYLKSGFFDEGLCVEWGNDWHYDNSYGQTKDIDLPLREGGTSDVDYVTISKRIPNDIRPGWYIVTYSSFQKMKVYIDGELVDDYEGNESLFSTRIAANESRFIPLKQEYAGKEVKIRIETRLRNYKESINTVRLGNKSGILYAELFESSFTFASGLVIIVLGLILLVLRTLMLGKGGEGRVYAYIGSTMVLLGCWFSIQACVSQIVFDDMAMSHFVELITLMLLPVPLLRYVNYSLKNKFEIVSDVMCTANLAVVIYSLFMCIIFRHDLMETLSLSHVAIITSILFIAISFFWTIFRDKELFYDLKWIELAFACLCVGAVVETIQFYLIPAKETGVSLAVSAIAYCACTFVWAIQNGKNELIKKENAIQQAKAKSLFLANMSHEIRTPINAILGMDSLIIRDSRQPQVRKYAEDLQDSGRKLLALINNILDFSRIESGNASIINNPYDISVIMSKAARFANTCGKNDNVCFMMTSDSAIPKRLVGDSSAIEKIADNLLENALRYTYSGDVCLSWKSEDVKHKGNIMLVITVSDTGKGISAEQVKHIFDPFSRTQKAEGTGLGLAVVRRLADLMSGTVTVSSTEGKGTVFTVKLPQGIASEDKDEAAVSIEGQKINDNPNFVAPKARILVIDDEPMNLKVVSGMLRDTRIYTDTVSSGEAALDRICNGKYQLIFLDCLMPGMNGIETIVRMQELSAADGNQNTTTPVILMTADNSQTAKDLAVKYGFSGYLGKPVMEEEMAEILHRFLPKKMVREFTKGADT